ncbi:MAG: hypothetical protein ACREVZ_00170 [Burkholderiales bacterium]
MAGTPARETPAYTCERADLARDRDAILAIWRGNLGREASLAGKYDWFYTKGEAGSPIAMLLRHASSSLPVGIAAAGPRRAIWCGRNVRIGVLVDMAVVPEHRSLYPALLLQRALQQTVPGEFAALYGFPNPKAAAVFVRAGYSRTIEVRRYVRVLRPGTYLRRRLPGWVARLLGPPLDLLLAAWDSLRARGSRAFSANWRADADPRVDDLWRATPHGTGPIAVRDLSFLRWRFDHKPAAAFRYLMVEGGGGRLVAWFACEDDETTLVIRDFWTGEGCDGLDPSIVWLLLREARKGGYSAVSMEFGGSAVIFRTLEAAGFAARSSRPFFSFFGPGPASARAAAWHVTSADEDE